MNTPTHLIINVAVLTRQGQVAVNLAVIAGALIPDLSIYVLFVWSKLAGIPEMTVWREIYWQEPWQTFGAISNSIPLYLTLIGIGFLIKKPIFWMFALSALLHLAFDFPFHADDAHRHFWPISDWRFHSPLSYWDSSKFGDIVSVVEMIAGAALCVVLWRRFDSKLIKAALVLAMISYIAVPLYFTLVLG